MSRAEFCRKYTQVAYTEETIVIGRFYSKKTLFPTGIENYQAGLRACRKQLRCFGVWPKHSSHDICS